MRESEANQEPGFGAQQLGNKLVGKEEEDHFEQRNWGQKYLKLKQRYSIFGENKLACSAVLTHACLRSPCLTQH